MLETGRLPHDTLDLIRRFAEAYLEARGTGCNFYSTVLRDGLIEHLLSQAQLYENTSDKADNPRKILRTALEIGLAVVWKGKAYFSWIPVDPLIPPSAFFKFAHPLDKNSFTYNAANVHRLPYEPNFVGAHNVFTAWRAVAKFLLRLKATTLWLKGGEDEMRRIRRWLEFANAFDEEMLQYLNTLKYTVSGHVTMVTPEHVSPNDPALQHIIDTVMVSTNRMVQPYREVKEEEKEAETRRDSPPHYKHQDVRPYAHCCHIHPGRVRPGTRE